ncbi:hypothetical protein NUACC26_072820 [Scytonema sp. NUACC26]
MHYQFQFRPYRRRFVRSLTTSHGVWDTREGIILKLTDDLGRVGWGEIAPINWFGSENQEEALLFCHQLPKTITEETIFSIPDELPACQFGFESAFWGLETRDWGLEDEVDKGIYPTSSFNPHRPLSPEGTPSSPSPLIPRGDPEFPNPQHTAPYYLQEKKHWRCGKHFGSRGIVLLNGK